MSVDERVMIELVGKKFPIETFEEEIGKVLKQKSGAKLLISNKPDTIKGTDGEFHAVNFKCIPQSSSCKNLFCFLLKHKDGMVLIKVIWKNYKILRSCLTDIDRRKNNHYQRRKKYG